MEYQFPLAEPEYTGKRTLDFAPFAQAMDGLDAQRTAQLDGLLAAATLIDIQRLMENRELSAAELVTYYAARIRRYDVGKLNAVMELNPRALETARELDAERASGTTRGPLHGTPVLIKDNIESDDGTATRVPSACGTRTYSPWPPSTRAPSRSG